MTQDGPKRSPRGTKRGPRSHQDRPKRAQDRKQPKHLICTQNTLFVYISACPGWSDCERGSNPVRAPRRPRRAPPNSERSRAKRGSSQTLGHRACLYSVYTYLYIKTCVPRGVRYPYRGETQFVGKSIGIDMYSYTIRRPLRGSCGRASQRDS